jgi:hypothetical protein
MPLLKEDCPIVLEMYDGAMKVLEINLAPLSSSNNPIAKLNIP